MIRVLLFLLAFVTIPFSSALAQEAIEPLPEVQYIFNTLLFLFCGALVMFMAAGFAMLESGLVRSKSTATILTKNIALYAIAGIMYYIVGYNLMYSNVDGGYIGTFLPWGADDSAAAAGDYSGGYAASSDWFFQMVFVATTASVVSGALAERSKLWPFLLFTAILTAILYPITGAWKWGGGWLDEMGFQDFAGSTLVHSVGGWAALAGVILLGARKGRYGKDGKPQPMLASNLPLATLGTFILWLGWFGFNGGSQLALGRAADAVAVANIFANTNMAAASGVVTVLILTRLLYKKVDLSMTLNGALAGLVSITAEPLMPTLGQAIVIGAVGGVIVMLAVPLLDKLKLDDVVGAIPVHLAAGIWGTFIVPLSNPDASYGVQLTGIAAIGAFTFICSFIIWAILKYTVGLRLTEEEEALGSDYAELGIDAYPDFVRASKY